jgi:hypothetical protein
VRAFRLTSGATGGEAVEISLRFLISLRVGWIREEDHLKRSSG